MAKITLTEWAKINTINNEMYWKKSATNQIDKFQKLADELAAPIFVIGSHMSKSIKLPVVEIVGSHGRFIIRDNFYDYNLAVDWDFPINMPMEDVYDTYDWNWYKSEMQRKERYCHWDEWTEEELKDPRITRIEVPSVSGKLYWKEYSIEEKERWVNRFKDTAWYTHDWSSGKLIVEGEIGSGCKLYKASYPFAQGIDVKYDYYKPGTTQFLIAVGEVSDIVKKINEIKEA